jgi:hypothetical protein
MYAIQDFRGCYYTGKSYSDGRAFTGYADEVHKYKTAGGAQRAKERVARTILRVSPVNGKRLANTLRVVTVNF